MKPTFTATFRSFDPKPKAEAFPTIPTLADTKLARLRLAVKRRVYFGAAP